MGAQDAAFLYAETPSWHLQVGSVMELDPSTAGGRFGVERMREVLADRLALVPTFRWKVRPVPFGLDRPVWSEARHVDLHTHVRTHTLVDGMSLDAFAAHVLEVKLDRDRPLWELWVVDGLPDGRVALVAKLHHALVDGTAATVLADLLFDLSPEPRPKPPQTRLSLRHEREPSPVELALLGAATTIVRGPERLARFAVQTARQAAAAVGPLRAGASHVAVPLTAPATSLNGEFGAERRLARTRLPLASVRAVARAADVKVNDVVLAVVGTALAGYLAERGEVPAKSLLAQVPVSRWNGERDHMGTKVGTMFATLATDVADPAERLRVIARCTRDTKQLAAAAWARRELGLADVTPPLFFSTFVRMYEALHLGTMPPAANVVISNVPGIDAPLYVAGARVESMVPIGPTLMGIGANVTLFGYCGSMEVGVFGPPECLPEPAAVATRIPAALDELVDAFGV